jgi:uncharacterized protein YjiS (DUF1127 family)
MPKRTSNRDALKAKTSGPKKEAQMASIKIITQKLSAWRRYRQALRELSQMSDHEPCDIGIHRCDIERIAHETAST